MRGLAGGARLTTLTTLTTAFVGAGADTGETSGAPTPIERPNTVAAVTVAHVSTVDDQ
ncbi:MAG: hypothetical protein QOF57_2680 [Frankiaceae bacterium]|nr:hypothetical protein [Frankiaceae bacterium]